MVNSLYLAHITDMHISDRSLSWSTVGALAPRLLIEAVALLNDLPIPDFVMITGDVIDTGSRSEIARYHQIIAGLSAPWHFVPGNHDGVIDPDLPDACSPEEAVSLIDPRMAGPTPYVQHAWWSRTVADGVQLIGLDSRLADDWAGIIGQPQMDWLHEELERWRNHLVILAVHHPLHALGEHNFRGRFPKFICSNGAEVEALLDQYPNVKLVLSGHHHANHISLANGHKRLHICTASLSGYPCAFRTIRLTYAQDGWRARVETHSTARPEDLKRAYEVALADHLAQEYNPDNPSAWADFCAGRLSDLTFEGLLA